MLEVGLAAIVLVGGSSGSGAAVCVGKLIVGEVCRKTPSLSLSVGCRADRGLLRRCTQHH